MHKNKHVKIFILTTNLLFSKIKPFHHFNSLTRKCSIPPPSPSGDCVAIGELVVVVILNEVKNLIISTDSTIEILRLLPQNDKTTQSPEGGGAG